MACTLAGTAIVVAHAQTSYVPERVFHSARGQFTDFEAMVADLAKAEVVFVGEQHDDASTHRLELAILQGLARRHGQVVVALEMFERDVQESIEHFAMGHMAEDEFLKSVRPWTRYKTDYKPLVDFAISQQWPVIASNAPQSITSQVSKGGLDALAAKTSEDKQWFAQDLRCPLNDDYFKRFAEEMGDHPSPPGRDASPKVGDSRTPVERYYLAQCLRDETMGESVARAYEVGSLGGKRPIVVHFNGSFHTDFGQGTAERARRRLSGKRVVVVSMLPVADLDAISPDKKERKRAEYLVYTLSPEK